MPRNPGCVIVVISDREITGIKKPFKVSKELLKRWILKICITLEIIHSISNRVPLVLMYLFSFQQCILLPLGQSMYTADLGNMEHNLAILVNMVFPWAATNLF